MNRALDACYKRGHRADLDEAGRRQRESPRDRARSFPSSRPRGSRPTRPCSTRSGPTSGSPRCCVSMRNTDQIRENAAGGADFQPLTKAEIDRLRDACIAAGPTMCASCDGRCSRAAGTDGRARQPDPVPDLPRPPRLPRRSPSALRRARRRRARLARRRPRGRPPGLPQPPRFRQALAAGG